MKRSRGTSKSDKDSIQEEGPDSDAEVSFTGRSPEPFLPGGVCAELWPSLGSLHPLGAALIIFSRNIMSENKCPRRGFTALRPRPGPGRATGRGWEGAGAEGAVSGPKRRKGEQGGLTGQALQPLLICSLFKGRLEIQKPESRITQRFYGKVCRI